MYIGGVLLVAGMQLTLYPGDYLHGTSLCRLLVHRVVETRHEWSDDWVVLTGMQQPSDTNPWQSRQVQVRVAALKRAMTSF